MGTLANVVRRRDRLVPVVTFNCVYRFGAASTLLLVRLCQRRVGSVLSMASTIRVPIGIGVAMFNCRDDGQFL